MAESRKIPIGVVLAREAIDNPWQNCVWRPVSVFPNPPEIDGMQEVRRSDKAVHYHVAMELELHPKEVIAYQANLADGEPSVYVVLRQDAECAELPVKVHLVSLSPYEAQAYGDSGFETVVRIPMPQPVAELLAAYVEQHPAHEPFVKRQRKPHVDKEDHLFGQEPLHVLRKRKVARTEDQGSDG
jgi:hypothetical protein